MKALKMILIVIEIIIIVDDCADSDDDQVDMKNKSPKNEVQEEITIHTFYDNEPLEEVKVPIDDCNKNSIIIPREESNFVSNLDANIKEDSAITFVPQKYNAKTPKQIQKPKSIRYTTFNNE